MTGNGRASAKVTKVNTGDVRSVNVSLLGGEARNVRYPVWYTPAVGDLVVIDWIGSQPFVASAFA